MILSDREIRAALARGAVRITPAPNPDSWSATAIDLTLDRQLSFWQPPPGQETLDRFRPHHPAYDFKELAAKFAKELAIPEDGYVIGPQSFVLGWTMEKIQLPHRSRIAARVEGKSSQARLGLGVHVTAPTIHAGFGFISDDPTYIGSPIQLEIWNIGPLEIILEKGMPICQLIFELARVLPSGEKIAQIASLAAGYSSRACRTASTPSLQVLRWPRGSVAW